MKNINRQIVKLLTPIFLLALCCACFFSLNSKPEPVLAETTSQVQTVNLTPDENGCLNLQKWEDFTPSSSTNPTAMTLSPSTDQVKVWGRTLEGTVYEIQNAADLAAMAKLVNSETSKNFSFVLNADIDLSGKIWTPIGISSTYCFKGKFYGNGHKISGVIIDSSINVSNDYKHLFGYVDSNAGIYDVLIETTYGCANASSLKNSGMYKGCLIDEESFNNNSNELGMNYVSKLVIYDTAGKNENVQFVGQQLSRSDNSYTQIFGNNIEFWAGETIGAIRIYEYDWELDKFETKAYEYTIKDDDQKKELKGLTINLPKDFGSSRVYNNYNKIDTEYEIDIDNNIQLKWNSTHQNFVKIVVKKVYKIVDQKFNIYTIDEEKIKSNGNDNNIYWMENISKIFNLKEYSSIYHNITYFALKKENVTFNDIVFRYDDNVNEKLEAKGEDYTRIFSKKTINESTISNPIDLYYINLAKVQITNTISYSDSNNTFSISTKKNNITAYYLKNVSELGFTLALATDDTDDNNKVTYHPKSGNSYTVGKYIIYDSNYYNTPIQDLFAYDLTYNPRGQIASATVNVDKSSIRMLAVSYSTTQNSGYLERKTDNINLRNNVVDATNGDYTAYAQWYVLPAKVNIELWANENELEGYSLTYYAKLPGSNDVNAREIKSGSIEWKDTEGGHCLTLYYTEKLYLIDMNSNKSQAWYWYLDDDTINTNPVTIYRDFEYSNSTYATPSSEETFNGEGTINNSSTEYYYAAAVISILQDGASYSVGNDYKKVGSVTFQFYNGGRITEDLSSYISALIDKDNPNWYQDNYLKVQYGYGPNADGANDDNSNPQTIYTRKYVTSVATFKGDFKYYKSLDNRYKVDMASNKDNIFTLTWKSTSRVGMAFDGGDGVVVSHQGVAKSEYDNNGALDYTSLDFKITQFNKNNESITITITLSKTENTFNVTVVDSDRNSDFNNVSYKKASEITINGVEYNNDELKLTNQGDEFTITYNADWFKVESDSIKCTVGGTLYVSQIASCNGNGTITITPSMLGAYYKDGISIVVTLTKIEKTLTLQAENGTIDNLTNQTTIPYYYNTNFNLSKNGETVTLTTKEYNNTSTTKYIINPTSSHYKYSEVEGIGMDTKTYGGNLGTDSITVTYSAKTYNIDWELGYYDSSNDNKWQDKNTYLKLSGLATSFDNGTLTAPSNTAVDYFTFSHYEIVKNDNGTLSTDNVVITEDNLINGYKFNSNVDIEGYLSDGKITIRMVYTPNLYTFEFTDDSSNQATKTTSAADASFDNTLLSLLDDALNKTGYNITGFILDKNTTYDTSNKVNEVITDKQNSQKIELTVCYAGNAVTLKFNVLSLYDGGNWTTKNGFDLEIKGTYGTAINFGKTLQEKVDGYESGIYKISEYSYNNIYWAPWTTLTETDSDISFNNFSNGTTEYTIYVHLVKITKTINFDKTYLSSETSIEFDSINNITGTIPTPTRAGFTFLGWGTAAKDVMIKAADSEWENSTTFETIKDNNNTDWKICYSSNLDEVTLYAYWEFTGFEGYTISGNTFIYDGDVHNVIITLPSGSGVNFACESISKNEGVSGYNGHSISTDNTLTLSGFKYVAHGGTYTVTLNCSLADTTGAGSSTYISNSGKISKCSISVEVTINKATLTITGNDDKVYDGTTDVNFTISGIKSDDKISAAYADANVGEKEINYTFTNDTNGYIAGSYTGLPPTGTISALTITVKVSGNAKTSSAEFKLAHVEWDNISYKSWKYTDNTYNLEISCDNYNNSDAWDKLNNRTTLRFGFDIYYKENNLVVENLIYTEGTTAENTTGGNIIVKIDSTNFKIVELLDGEKGYTFKAYLDTDTNKESPIIINFKDGNNLALNLTKNNEGKYETTTTTEGDDTFKVNFGDYINYWIKQVKVNNEEQKPIPTADPNNYFTLTIAGTEKAWTTVEIVITKTSNVTLNYRLVDGEEITDSSGNQFDVSSNSTKTFTYDSSFELPTGLQRTGFTFCGWSLSKEGDAINSSTWNIKQTEVTLYAVWTFVTPTLTTTGNITKEYNYNDEESSIELTEISNKNKNLTYEYSWQKQNNGKWEDVSGFVSIALTVKNVADSGTYRAVLTKVCATVGGDTITYYEKPETNSTETPIASNSITVAIRKKNVEFVPSKISKIFDGFATYEYTISDDDFTDDINNELSGKKIIFTFKDGESNSINAGTYSYGATTGKMLSVETLDDTFNNYNIVFKNGFAAEITQRSIKFDIGEKSKSCTGSVRKVTYNKDTDDIVIYDLSKDPSGETKFDETNVNFKFTEIIVQTNKAFVGVYPDSTNDCELEIWKVAAVDKSNESVTLSNRNFDFTIAGTFTITKGSLNADNVTISNTTITYNGNIQKIHVEIVNILSTAPFTCLLLDKNGEELSSSLIQYTEGKFSADISTGKKDVGDYEFKIKLKSNYYEDFTSETIIFKITTLSVNVNNKKDVTYSKTYDGTTNAKISTDYFDFTYENNVQLGDSLVAEIKEYYTFLFVDKNVGTNITISSSINDSNYKNISIFGNLSGDITKAEIWLKVEDTKVYESVGKYTIAYNKITKVDSNSKTTEVIDSDIITSGDITITLSDSDLIIGGEGNQINYNKDSNNYTLKDLIIDKKDISENYSVLGVCGTITINKAIIKVTLTKTEYEYTAQNAKLAINASLQTNAEQPYTTISYDSYLTMTVYTGQGDSISTDKVNGYKNVGSYTARFTPNSSSYYTIEGAYTLDDAEYKDLSFEITKKAITIIVNETHYYNGNKAEYNLNAVSTKAGLITGHTFGNVLQTSLSMYGTYYVNNSSQVSVLDLDKNSIDDDSNEEKIIIYEGSDNVSDNYNVTLSGTIEIVAQNASIKYIGGELTYNGAEQKIKLELTLSNTSGHYFEVVSKVEGTGYTYTVTQYADKNFNTSITSAADDENKNKYISDVSASVTLGNVNIGFKYAGEYTVKLNVGLLSAETKAKISPKLIGANNINYTNTKVYDGNTKVYDGNTEVSGESLTGLCNADAACFNVSAKFSDKNVGTNKVIIFTLSEKTSDYSTYIFNSYTTNNNDENGNKILYVDDGKITARSVTFTYNNSEDHYYTGQALTLNASAFDISRKVNDETFSGTGIAGETFTGDITFDNIIDAGEYGLNSSTNVDTTNLKVSNSELTNYTITFTGSVTINKAQVVVDVVSNNSYTYDGTGKTATLTAKIYEGKGAIDEGVAASILTATYVDINDTELTEAINAGTYSIKPKIASEYENNYTYVGAERLDTQLKIEKRNITIEVVQSIYIEKLNNGNFEYELGNDDVAMRENGDQIPQLVSGHTLTGKISTNRSSVGDYEYSGTLENISITEITENLTLNDYITLLNPGIVITNTEEVDCSNNYSVTLNIELSITNTLSDGELYIKANNLTYNGKNQWENVQNSANNVFNYTINDPNITEITFSNVYFFTNKTNADNALNALKDAPNTTITGNTTELINAGTYYAIVIYNTTAVYSNVIEVTIAKITISSLQFNSGAVFDFTKTYDGNAYVTGLTSTDILEDDKSKFSSITATFYTDSTKQTPATNAGEGYYIGFEFVAETSLTTVDLDSLENNYKFESKTGTINKKDVMLSLSKEYDYAGKTTYTIEASEFTKTGLVGSDELSGDVTINVENVGTYDSSCITENGNALKVSSNNIESNNYAIKFESFSVEVKALEVELSKIDCNLTYKASDLKDDVVEKIISVDNTTFETEIKDQLKDQFYNIFTVKIDETEKTNIKNAATYTLTIKQVNSGNFKFAFNADTTSIQFNVNKATLTINLGETTLAYSDYVNNSGYTPTMEQVEGLCEGDAINCIKITIAATIYIDQKYSGDSLTCSLGTLENNYTATVAGSLTLTYPTDGIELEYDPITYNGKTYDLFNDLKVYFKDNKDTALVIDKKDKTQVFSNVYDSNGNKIDYIIYVKVANINEPIYKELTINVTPKTVSTINYKEQKTYDGTNVVYNADGESELSSNYFVKSDNVYATGTYSSYSVGDWGITFELNGADAKNYVLSEGLDGLQGEITQKEITINVEDEFTFSYKKEYNHTLTEISGLVSGDSLSEAKLTFTLENAGTHTIDSNNNQPTPNIIIKKDSEDVSNCYNFSFTGEITINPKEFSISFSNTSTTFNNGAQYVTYSINNKNQWDEEEINNLEESITISYSDADGKTVSGPTNAGTYTAKASCSNTNYSLTGEISTDFEITKYTYTITEVSIFSRTESDTTPLIQSYNIDFGVNGTLPIVVTFEKADSSNTLGVHNIKVVGCNNSNIDVVCDNDLLKGKLTITPDYSKTLTVTLTSFKEGVSNTRQYGMKDINKFALNDFVYTCKVDSKTLTSDEIDIISLTGNIFFATGDVGEHGYSSHELTSSYNTIEIETDLKLIIEKRTIEVTAESYNKVFDGTTDFVNEISCVVVTNRDEFDESLLPTISLKYESKNAGNQTIVVECSDSINFNVVLKDEDDNTITTGEISKLTVSISLKDDVSSFTYGNLSVTSLEDEKFVDMFEYCNITSDSSSKITSEKLKELIVAKIECEDEDVSTSNKLNVKTYSLTFQNLSEENIDLTQNAVSITVTQKEVTLKIKDSSNNLKEISKEQDGTTDVVLAEGEELVLDGIVDGDVVSVDNAQFDAEISKYGENIQINVTTSGADVGNYSIVASGTITRKVLVIKFDYSLSKIEKGDISQGTSYKEYGYYEKAKEVPSPTHEQGGYTFVGWGKSAVSTDVIDFTKPLNEIFTEYSQEITVYAIWKINQFEIDFVTYKYTLESGSYENTDVTYSKQTINYGEEFDIKNIAQEIEFEHYTFAGYCLSETDAKNYANITTVKHVVEKDVTIYLVYNLNQYSVIFESDVAFNEINKSFEYLNENKTLKITDYYGKKLGDINAGLSTYLSLEKEGYTFNGYSAEKESGIITVDNLLGRTISGETTYTAKFTANTYTLTLNANGGKFESLTGDWSYKTEGDTSIITKDVTFDSIVLLPEPTRAGYNFDGYKYSDKDVNLTNFAYNFADNVEFVAKWGEKDFTLTIATENVKEVVVKYYDSDDKYFKTETKEPTNDSFTFTVSTSNRVEIIPTGNLGYVFNYFVIGDFVYNTNSTYKSTTDFVENTTWKIVYGAKTNLITFEVNNANYGSVECNPTSTTKNNPLISVCAETGTPLIISAKAVEGYQLVENGWEVYGDNYDLVKIEKSDKNYVVSGFVGNVKVKAIFEPKEVKIRFVFDEDVITVLCNSKNHSSNFVITPNVEEVVTFTLTVKDGYSLEGVTFIPSGSTNTGEIEKNGLEYKFTGFTSNGTIKIETKKEKYKTTFILAEFDETNETINEISNTNDYVKNFASEITEEYKNEVKFTPNICVGYKVKCWQIKQDGSYVDLRTQSQSTYSNVVEKNVSIRLVIERETYTITYTTSNGGSIKNSKGAQMESFTEEVRFGRDAKGATAEAWSNAEFVGWFENETIVETNATIKRTSDNANHTYVAKFNGETITFVLKIYTNTAREDLTFKDLNNFVLSGENVTNVEREFTYSSGQQVVVLKADVVAYLDVTLEIINLPSWFEIESSSGNINSDGKIVFAQVKTNSTTEDGEIGSYSVNLKVKTFTITINANNINGIVIKNGSSHINKTDGNIIVVDYGANLVAELNCLKGYMITNVSNVDSFENNIVTINEIKSDITCDVSISVSKFKVRFNFNYEGKSQGKQYPDVTNYVYYVYYGQTDFVDENDQIVTLPESIVNPQNKVTDPLVFLWWNSAQNGLGSYNYNFENGKITTTYSGKQISGFVYDLINSSTGDYIDLTLYAIWNQAKNVVSVEFSPVDYTGDITTIFGSSTKKFIYNNKIYYVVDATVTINAPSISGYTYYGWKMNGETEINKEYLSFTMPEKDVTVTLYYSFEITVDVKEPIKAGSTATINGKSSENILAGELFTIKATPGKGLAFDYWTVDGVKNESLNQEAVVTSDGKPHKYVAVFKVKTISVSVENTNLVTLRTNKTEFGIGETIVVYVDFVADGYKITDVLLNKLGNSFTLSDDKTCYLHIITINDAEIGELIISSVTNLKTYNFKIESNLSGAGTILVNEQNLELFDAVYNFDLNIATTESVRYALKQISVNGVVIKTKQDTDLLNFVITLNTSTKFNLLDESVNIISFEFEKYFWIDTVEPMTGEGTENNPFLIANEKQFAYMAKMLNSGEINQTNSHLYYMLTANLNLEQAFWIPIGTKEHPFNGTFNLNDHSISFVVLDPDQTYEVLAWETKLYGVFGYVTDSAELLFNVSKLPIILVVSISALFVVTMIVVIAIIIVKKKRKIQKLSKKISTETLTKTSTEELTEQELEEFNTETKKTKKRFKKPKE